MYKYLIPLSLFIFLLSFWKRNDFGGDLQLLPILQQEPIQEPVRGNPFEVTIKDRTYTIEPEFSYELYGLVVSYQLHDGNYGLHRLWDDHLNVADVCVIWQETAASPFLADINFWNGQFTCNVRTYSDEAWASFRMNQLSNNHLISEDAYLRDQISQVSIGDQIKIKGWLSSYGSDQEGKRGTSTTREDTGNGACETIYVHEFEILSHYSNAWRKIMYGAFVVLVLSLVGYFRQPFRVKQ